METNFKKKHTVFQYNAALVCSNCAEIFGVIHEYISSKRKVFTESAVKMEYSADTDPRLPMMDSKTPRSTKRHFQGHLNFSAKSIQNLSHEASMTQDDCGMAQSDRLALSSATSLRSSMRNVQAHRKKHQLGSNEISRELTGKIAEVKEKSSSLRKKESRSTIRGGKMRDFQLHFGMQQFPKGLSKNDKKNNKVNNVDKEIDRTEEKDSPLMQVGNIAQSITTIARGTNLLNSEFDVPGL